MKTYSNGATLQPLDYDPLSGMEVKEMDPAFGMLMFELAVRYSDPLFGWADTVKEELR